MESAQPLPQILPHLRIKRAKRFVEQQDSGFSRQRSRQGDTLPLTAGKLDWVARLQALEPNQFQEFPHPLANFRLGCFPHPQPVADVLCHGHVAKESVMLEDETHLAVARGLIGDVFLLVQHVPRIGHLEAGNDAQESCFA